MELVLCSQSAKYEELCGYLDIGSSRNKKGEQQIDGTINAYTPCFIDKGDGVTSQMLLAPLSNHNTTKNLTNIAISFGEENTLALVELLDKFQSLNASLVAPATSVYAARMEGFTGAVKNYQEALLNYGAAVKQNMSNKQIAKQKAHSAYGHLQKQFKNELSVLNKNVSSRKGTPLSNLNRATNIARSSRSAEKLSIVSQVEAGKLVRFTKHAKYLGNGLAVIDFTSRAGNVYNEYKADGEWERELFIESSSFVLSSMAGAAVVNVGTTALGLLMVATPIGWIGLVFGGIAVAGAAAATSISLNNSVKNNAGGLYDEIMNWTSSL